MKTRFLFIIISFTALTSNAQNLVWAKNFGVSSEDYCFDITVDPLNNFYFLGNWGSNDTLFEYKSEKMKVPKETIILTKYDNDGSIIYIKNIISNTGNYNITDASIITDKKSDIYISGMFEGDSIYYKPHDSVLFHIRNQNGHERIFISKLDSAGNILWLKQFDRQSEYYSKVSLTVDDNRNLYAIGNILIKNSKQESNENVILKIDSSGNIIKHFGVKTNDCDKISLDADNNIFICGDSCVAKFDSNGVQLWKKFVNSIIINFVTDLSGNSYFAGIYIGAYKKQNGEYVSIGKFNTRGKKEWSKIIGKGYQDRGYSIKTAKNSIYITGQFEGRDVDFNPPHNVLLSTCDTVTEDMDVQTSYFVAGFTTDGKFQWVFRTGGSSDDYPTFMALDGNNNIYLTGTLDMGLGVDFDPGKGKYELKGPGCFIAKYHY